MENLCIFDGCNKIVRVKSRGLCSGHNWQFVKGYDLYPIGSKYKVTNICSYGPCGKEYFCNGYCMFHYNLVAKIGITPEDYAILEQKQFGSCAICQKQYSGKKERFSVDHDHSCCPGRKSCGKCIRGLLCDKCNLGIGNFDDRVELLNSAIDYLKSH